MYYNLLQNWQNPFTAEMCRDINLSCLILRSQLGYFGCQLVRALVTPFYSILHSASVPPSSIFLCLFSIFLVLCLLARFLLPKR